jgi:hypothetical protein
MSSISVPDDSKSDLDHLNLINSSKLAFSLFKKWVKKIKKALAFKTNRERVEHIYGLIFLSQ